MRELLTEWLEFLSRHGVDVHGEPSSQDAEAVRPTTGFPPIDNFVAPQTHLGLIALTGDEAARFLHNQLTNDVENLGPSDVRLAGYCSPKGRLLASMLCWRSADAIFLQLPVQLQAAIQKRLQMFVLRAKVTLRDASDEYITLGLAGLAAAKALEQWFPQLPPQPYSKVESDTGTLIRVADLDQAPRFQWLTSLSTAMQAWPVLTDNLQPTEPGAWRLAEIRAGIPSICQATQEQFVPQMINFELIGGVNFKKGCYPGQEIVARSQYLGKLKRRMLLATVEGTNAQAGIEVFSSADPDQPCGMIVNAESSGGHQIDCLVELKLAAVENGTVHLGSPEGALLQFKPLPYALPDSM